MIIHKLILLLAGVFYLGTAPAENSFVINGTITDAETEEAVSFAYIHIEELDRTGVSDINGSFQLKNIPSGNYTLTIHRIGYRTQSRRVTVEDQDIELSISLTPSVLSGQSIEVLGVQDELVGSGLEHASRKVVGTDLRRNLGNTLSKTLSNLPGFDERSMGSAPGRPVIRGLGDERVLILQDGVRSGDVSDQSSDHAVTIDPISAQEVEIARGPAALAYGANAVGGVINIVRNQIETSVPRKTTGNATLNGESVNKGLSGALDVTMPYKDFALSLDLNGRLASNTQSPAGEIQNTQFRATNDAVGLSWVQDWGYIGGAFSTYLNHYGIPPDPQGGHPNGVDIEMRKFQYDLKSEVVVQNDFLKVIESDFSIKNYTHREIESSGIQGTKFGLVTTNAEVKAKYGAAAFLERGTFGIWGELEDYAVVGANTPDANSYKIGTYLIEETNINDLHVEAGLRFDWVLNQPKENDPDSPIGNIRSRSFPALSSSVAAVYSITQTLSAGANFLHSFRAPSLEELYSEGPHLASYSFEVGNPELNPERSLAKELFIRYKTSTATSEVAIFHNDFSNYLYARDTGQQNNSNPDLNNYQFVGADALLYGTEFTGEIQLLANFVFSGSLSYTIGKREVPEAEQIASGYSDNTRPLPQVPPFKARFSGKYVKDGFELGSSLRLAAEQDRTGEFETSTKGYTILDLFSQYRFNKWDLLHTLSVNVNNLLNREYYNHLSRIKDIRPEPGRNISLLYRMYF